ncbi:LysR family transcriptional regulator [Salinimonas sediminis]|uniref:LysR family transcriptional regulator n=1 Tax=Salinimonas sediminis TaxID=2303538 RepID=A0A346NMX8_9ALTE|nr:LysR family transcriptional regulator [Salinimonas sediminis]AXR06885.1 LysR family transcriptional regulator [Salinimonas sediminis]
MSDHKRMERLMLFVELARQLNFTRAARKLGISKGYLSEQVKKLETELKCPLLVRTTRSVRLTREGERALAQGLNIRSQVFQLERSVNEENEAVSGLLRITAPKMFAETFLFSLCSDFQGLHPDILFEINCSYTTHNLNQQDIDVAFRATTTPPDDMVVSELLPYTHLLVASPAYLANYGEPQHIDDLAQHACLATLHQKSWPLKQGPVDINGWLATNENHLLRQQALKGKGIIRVANYYVADDIARGELQVVLPEECLPMGNSIYLFHPQLVYPSQKLKTFTRFVRDYFANHSPERQA